MSPILQRWWKHVFIALAVGVIAFTAYLSDLTWLAPGAALQPRSLDLTLSTDRDQRIQVILDLADSGAPWTAPLAVTQPALPGLNRLVFPLADGRIRGLRLDFGNRPGELRLVELGMTTRLGARCTWPAAQIMRLFPEPSADVGDITLQSDGLHIQTRGIDGFLLAKNSRLEQECDGRYAGAWQNRLLQLGLAGLLAAGLAWLFGRVFRPPVRAADYGLCVLALILLLQPLAGWLFERGNLAPNVENRPLAVLPAFPTGLNDIIQWPGRVERYFNDHFGWRTELVHGLFKARTRLGASPSPDVVIGQDGWLYYSGSHSLRDYQGLQPLGPYQKQAIYKNLAAFQSAMQAQGRQVLFVIAPDKQSIYPEFLPAALKKVAPSTRLDDFLAYNQHKDPLPILDLRSSLLEAKAHLTCAELGLPLAACPMPRPGGAPGPLLYYRTDTHWNTLGAYVASRAIATALQPDFPAVQALPLDTYDAGYQKISGFGLAAMIWQQDVLQDDDYWLKPHSPPRALPASLGDAPADALGVEAAQVDDPALPSAVMYHDSFTMALMPYLKEHFRRIVFVWSNQADLNFIAREAPEVVIFEIVERDLITLAR